MSKYALHILRSSLAVKSLIRFKIQSERPHRDVKLLCFGSAF